MTTEDLETLFKRLHFIKSTNVPYILLSLMVSRAFSAPDIKRADHLWCL